MEKSMKDVLNGIPEAKLGEILTSLMRALKEKGLTYRQAEIILEYTKDLLRDQKF